MTTALGKMGVDIVHAQGNEGIGVRVGIISNGLGSHSAIKGGYDFGKNQPLSGLSDDPTFISYGVASRDDLLAVAPKAHVYDLKITSNGITPTGAVVSALDWAVTNKMEILVLGFAQGESQSKNEAIDRCAAAGIVMFAGVGGAETNLYGGWWPATHKDVIAISCFSPPDGGPHYYYWKLIDWGFIPPYIYRIAYPLRGSVVLAIPWLVFDRQPAVWPATAAGVAALLIADGAKTSEVRNILKLTAEKLPDWQGYPSADLYGSGLVRADLAVAYDRTTGQVKEGPVLGGGGPESFFGDYTPKPVYASAVRRPDGPVMARYPYPRDGQTNFPPRGKCRFQLKSFTDGIDLNAVKVVFDCEVYTSAHPDFVWSGDRGEYDIEVPLPQPKGYNEPVLMRVEARDFAGRDGIVYEGVA